MAASSDGRGEGGSIIVVGVLFERLTLPERSREEPMNLHPELSVQEVLAAHRANKLSQRGEPIWRSARLHQFHQALLQSD